MGTVKEELEHIHDGVNDLVTVTKDHSQLSTDLVERVESFESDITRLIDDAVNITSYELDGIRTELAMLAREVISSLEDISELNYKSQINSALIAGVSRAVSSTILGWFFKSGMEALGNKVGDALMEISKSTTVSEQDLKMSSFLGLIHQLENRKPYLTFKYIVDVAADETQHMFTREEAKHYLSALITEGVIIKYRHGNLSAVRLNIDHPRLRAVLQTCDEEKKSSE